MKAHLPSLDDCVHCGLCLPACPTYAIDMRESQNPRGRIAALRAIDEGRAALSPALVAGLEDCLVCRACESACPSGISMETLLLRHRAQTRPAHADRATRLERWLLEEVIAHPERLEFSLGALRLARGLLTASGVRDLPARSRLTPGAFPATLPPRGPPRGSVSILRGCVADRLFHEETHVAGRLLAHFGFSVSFGSAGCCGALHRHAGLEEGALSLARARAADLLATAPDHVISDSAGCGAALSEPLTDDASLVALADRVTDTPSLLARLDLPPPPHPITEPIAFFTPCHQSHGTGTSAATRALLARISTKEVVEFIGEEFCCGAAGMYVLRRPEKSRRLGEVARGRWERSGSPKIVATGNPGCLLRWESLIGSAAEVVHPVTLAARAYGVDGFDEAEGSRNSAPPPGNSTTK